MGEDAQGASRRGFKAGWWGLLVLGLSLCVCLLALELILRSCLPLYLTGHRQACRYDGELGFRLQAGVHDLTTTDHQQEIRTNPLGTTNFQEDFGDYHELIFAVGDSFTQGTGLPADASYPAQLDLILNLRDDRYTKRFAVVNLGLAGYGGRQNLIQLEKQAGRLGQPRYILYLGCRNDYEDDLLFEAGHMHGFLVAGNPRWPWYLKPLGWWAYETEVGKRVKVFWGGLKRARIFSRAPVPPGERSPSAAEHEEPIFQALQNLAERYGARLIVSWSGAPAADDASYDWLKEYAGRNHIAFADWHPAVASVRQAIPHLPLMNPHSGGHYRTWVNQQVARAYAKHIIE